VRITNVTGDGELWVQADRLVFDDGIVRITKEALVAGHDGATLLGGVGNDTLVGGMGADFLHGGDGDDMLVGGMGDDTIVSQSGTDVLLGGDGDDLLVVAGLNGTAAGQAVLTGGGGADVFAIASSSAGMAFNADVRIEDFDTGADSLDLSGLRVREADQSLRMLEKQDVLDAFVEGVGIDLAQFVTAHGENVAGTIDVRFVGDAPHDLSAAQLVLDPSSSSVDSDGWSGGWNVI